MHITNANGFVSASRLTMRELWKLKAYTRLDRRAYSVRMDAECLKQVFRWIVATVTLRQPPVPAAAAELRLRWNEFVLRRICVLSSGGASRLPGTSDLSRSVHGLEARRSTTTGTTRESNRSNADKTHTE